MAVPYLRGSPPARGRRRGSSAMHKREETRSFCLVTTLLQLLFGRIRVGPKGWECDDHAGAGPARPGPEVQAGSGGARREENAASSSGASLYLPKMFSYSCSMSSTIWFW